MPNGVARALTMVEARLACGLVVRRLGPAALPSKVS